MRTRPAVDARRIDSAGFARLLARLDPDPDRAGAAYERLRATLEQFFDWHAAWPPDECADETLDRLSDKFAAETLIDNVPAYTRGIARLVLLEWQRRPAPVSIEGRFERSGLPAAPEVDNEGQDEAQLGCFDRCLAALAEDSRALVLDYYVGDRSAKIDNRRRLQQTLGLSDSALRNRVQRVRNRLEQCVQECTDVAAGAGRTASWLQPFPPRHGNGD